MKIIDCKSVRQQMLEEAKLEINKIHDKIGKKLKLVVIQVEGDSASDVYIRNKIKTCEECGVNYEHVKLPSDITVGDVYCTIKNYVLDESVHGLMLQLPLPEHLKPYQQDLLDAIPWYMDVDGLTTESIGKLWSGQDCITPATAQGIMRLLPEDLSGYNIAIINRSSLIGKPLAKLILDRNGTPIVCHSKTNSIYTGMAYTDISITAMGRAKSVKYYEDFFNDQMIIDAAICRDENGKLCGDIDIETFEDTDCSITPVPNGVGLLTTAQLILNLIKCYSLYSCM